MMKGMEAVRKMMAEIVAPARPKDMAVVEPATRERSMLPNNEY